jgi:hypothetical protein
MSSRPAWFDELERRYARDQEARMRMVREDLWADEVVNAELRAVDVENTRWLKGVLTEHGWPGTDEVGDQGAQHIWMLAQHADQDVKFQRYCLTLLTEAVAAGRAPTRALAYLTDRVRVADGLDQVFGTQYTTIDGAFTPQPIEDPDNLDRRRADAGMETAAEYDRHIRSAYGT